MTIKELRELRAAKLAAMNKIKADKGSEINTTDIAAMKSLGDEMSDLDLQIQAIELTRDHAVNHTRKPVEKTTDFEAKQYESFGLLIRGKISAEKYKRDINEFRAATGAYDIGAGAELVPKEFVRILKERVLEYGMIVPELDKIETSNHGVLEYPTMDDTANSAYWMDEHGTFTLEDFATGKIEMNAFKLGTGVVISNELIEDAFFDIVVYAANLLGLRIGRTLEAAVINGDGIKKPLGILNTIAITGTVKAIVNVATATTGVVVPEDLNALIAAVQPSQRAGAKFYVGDDILTEMTEWVDTTGRPLLQPLAISTVATDVVYTYRGYPIQANYELGGLVAGDECAIFGNVKHYTLRVVRGVRVKASDEVNMLTDETVVVASGRYDGRVTSVNNCFSKLTIAAVTSQAAKAKAIEDKANAKLDAETEKLKADTAKAVAEATLAKAESEKVKSDLQKALDQLAIYKVEDEKSKIEAKK